MMEFHPLADLFPLMQGGEYTDLVADIQVNGLIEPITLHEGKILDGRNRYRACVDAGIEPVYQEFSQLPGTDDPVTFVVSLNLKRRHLNETERSKVAARLTNLKRGRPGENPQICGISTQRAAEMLNVGTRSVEHARAVQDRAAPELQSAVESGAASVSAASELSRLPPEEQSEIVACGPEEIKRAAARLREEKARENAQKRAEIAAKKADVPDGQYSVVVIDPPWPMQKIDRDVRPNQTGFDYPTMSEDELSELVIPVADDCHVWLWTTHKFLPMALRLLDQWGLKYVCTFVWHKPGGFQPIGLPQYNCEFALYARKGAPAFSDTKAFPTCFNAPRGEHSEKPQAFYDMVRRVTLGKRIDMFNRREIEGFDTWGKEAA